MAEKCSEEMKKWNEAQSKEKRDAQLTKYIKKYQLKLRRRRIGRIDKGVVEVKGQDIAKAEKHQEKKRGQEKWVRKSSSS